MDKLPQSRNGPQIRIKTGWHLFMAIANNFKFYMTFLNVKGTMQFSFGPFSQANIGPLVGFCTA